MNGCYDMNMKMRKLIVENNYISIQHLRLFSILLILKGCERLRVVWGNIFYNTMFNCIGCFLQLDGKHFKYIEIGKKRVGHRYREILTEKKK